MPIAEDDLPEVFRLLIVPGITMGKWSRVWSKRLPETQLRLLSSAEHAQLDLLLSGEADAGLVRLPIDKEQFHAIPLYTEATVVVFPQENELAEFEEFTLADLADLVLTQPLDDVLDWGDVPQAPQVMHRPATTAAAIEYVAASVGVLLVPQSLARLHHRRDLTYRVVTDAPQSSIALVWHRDRQTDLVEEMIGIVRGRTANSSRGRSQQPASSETEAAKSAKPSKAAKSTKSTKAAKSPNAAKSSAAKQAKRSDPRRGGSKPGRRKR